MGRQPISSLPIKLSFLDVHISQAVRAVAATVSEGVFVYVLFISPEALHDLGASDDVEPCHIQIELAEHALVEDVEINVLGMAALRL